MAWAVLPRRRRPRRNGHRLWQFLARGHGQCHQRQAKTGAGVIRDIPHFFGLQYKETVIAPAQTERRSDSGPARSLLGGKASPAADFTLVHQSDSGRLIRDLPRELLSRELADFLSHG